MTDSVAAVLAFIFSEDQKENPMPIPATQVLFDKIQEFIQRKEV